MRSILVSILLVCVFAANGQFVSLSKQECKQLKKEIQSDTAAAAIYSNSLETARRSLDDTPGPIELIRSQGLLMGDTSKMKSLRAVQDVNKIMSLALVYVLDNDKLYLKKASEFLLSWARINKPDGNPINETKLEDAVFAYDLIRSDLPETDRSIIDSWLRSMIAAESVHVSSQKGKGTAVNNWNSHRIKMMTMIAYILRDGTYEKLVQEELKKQILNNLNPDGSSYDFYERDALNYHIFSVDPLLKTAIILKRATGLDYFTLESPKGGSIKKSVDFLVPYMTGEKKHQEFLNSKVRFDRQRAGNNEKGYQIADFIPYKGIVALSPATYFDEKYLKVIQKAAREGNCYLDWQILLNRVRRQSVQP